MGDSGDKLVDEELLLKSNESKCQSAGGGGNVTKQESIDVLKPTAKNLDDDNEMDDLLNSKYDLIDLQFSLTMSKLCRCSQ